MNNKPIKRNVIKIFSLIFLLYSTNKVLILKYKLMIVKKKIPPKYFDLISSGKKKFELRVADFDIKVGDTLLLEEYDPKKKIYTGRKLEKKVSYKFNFSL